MVVRPQLSVAVMPVNPDQPSSPPKPASKVVPLWGLTFVAFIWLCITMSADGQTSWHCSVGLIPIFSGASYLYFGFPRGGVLEQIFGTVAFAWITGILIKN